jgi:hypothetical protein
MHTRRMATFLLGAWLGCSVFMALLVAENLRSPDLILAAPPAPASRLVDKLGKEDASLLLSFQAAEQNRSYLTGWEAAQFVLGLSLAAFLFLGTQRRALPLILCGAMIALVAAEHFVISPELVSSGRETDFPPGNRIFQKQARVWTIQQAYIGLEGTKLLIGGVLASYLFVFRARRRSGKQVQAVDHPNHSHVDG